METEANLAKQRAKCDSLFALKETENPTEVQRKRFKAATLANVDVRKVLEELLKLGIMRVEALPNNDRGGASAAHEEEAARALKRLRSDGVWTRAAGQRSSPPLSAGASARSGSTEDSRPSRHNPRSNKVRSNSLRHRALRPPPLSGHDRAGMVGAMGHSAGRAGSLLRPRDYDDAGIGPPSDDERVGSSDGPAAGAAPSSRSATGAAGPDLTAQAERRYLALRVTQRSAEATHRGAQLVQQVDTLPDSGLGSRLSSSGGTDVLSAGGMPHRGGLFGSGSTIRDGTDAYRPSGPSGLGFTTTEAGAVDVDVDRLLAVLWPETSENVNTGAKSESTATSAPDRPPGHRPNGSLGLPSSEPSESSLSDASSGYSSGSSRPASILSHGSASRGVEPGSLQSPPTGGLRALRTRHSPGLRPGRRPLAPLVVPGQPKPETPSIGSHSTGKEGSPFHPKHRPPSMQVKAGRGPLIRGLLRGQATEEVTLSFSDGFLRDIVYHRTMHALRQQLHARAATALKRFVEEDEARRKLHSKKLNAITMRSRLARRASHLAHRLDEHERSHRLRDEWQACRTLLASLLANPWRPLLPVFLRVQRERDKHRYRHLMFASLYDEAEKHYKRAFENKRRASGSKGRRSDASSASRDSDAKSIMSRKMARKRTRMSLMAGLQSTAGADAPHGDGHGAAHGRGRRGSLSKHVSEAAEARVAVEVVYSAVLAADEAAKAARRVSGDGVPQQQSRPHRASDAMSRSHAIVPFQSGEAEHTATGPRGGVGVNSVRPGWQSARTSHTSRGRSSTSSRGSQPPGQGQLPGRVQRQSTGGSFKPRDGDTIAAVDQMQMGQPLDWRGRMRQDLRGRFILNFGHRAAAPGEGKPAEGGTADSGADKDVFRSLRDGALHGRRSSAPSLEHGHSLLVTGSGSDLLAGIRQRQHPGSNAPEVTGRRNRSSLPHMPVFLTSPVSSHGLQTGQRRVSQPLDTIKEGRTPAKQRKHDPSLLEDALKDVQRVSSSEDDDDDDDDRRHDGDTEGTRSKGGDPNGSLQLDGQATAIHARVADMTFRE